MSKSTAVFDMFVGRYGDVEGKKKFQEWTAKMSTTKKNLKESHEKYLKERKEKETILLTTREVSMMQVSVKRAYMKKKKA